MSELKKCSKCLDEKSLYDFNKAKNKKYGVSSVCKECHSEYRKNHYLLNKVKVLKQVSVYKKNNPVIIKSHKMNVFSKKAGRSIECKCSNCDNSIFKNKDDFNNINKLMYCSKECKIKNSKSDYYYYLKQVEKRAKKMGREFDLDENFIKDLLEQVQCNKCNVSNIGIKLYNLKDIKSLYNTASLDRINSNKGYTKDNIQWICLGINYMKLDYTNDELHEILELIKDNYTGVAQRQSTSLQN